jgi:hypothetical protein
MLNRPPTDDEVRSAFASVLADVLSSQSAVVPVGLGLDDVTTDALARVGVANESGRELAIAEARSELERQLDGTHSLLAEQKELAAWQALRSNDA